MFILGVKIQLNLECCDIWFVLRLPFHYHCISINIVDQPFYDQLLDLLIYVEQFIFKIPKF